jgi:hypothetical protein
VAKIRRGCGAPVVDKRSRGRRWWREEEVQDKLHNGGNRRLLKVSLWVKKEGEPTRCGHKDRGSGACGGSGVAVGRGWRMRVGGIGSVCSVGSMKQRISMSEDADRWARSGLKEFKLFQI